MRCKECLKKHGPSKNGLNYIFTCAVCGKRLGEAQKPEAVKSKSNDWLCAERLDYIKRLVSGVEEQVAKGMVEIDGDNCTPSKWIDASLLCSVIKKEILRT